MFIGIVKVKVLAVLLGPVGIGLMGLYLNIMGIASMLAGCGMASSGVRQVAASVDDAETLVIVRRALWLGSLILGFTGMAILWVLGEQVSQWVFGDNVHASDVGWLGVGLLFTLIAGSQTALLQGLRRISDLAWVSIFSALVGALVGVLAVYLLGKDGVIWFVVTAPAANFLLVKYYTSRLPKPQMPYDLSAIQQQWLAVLKLGIPLMTAGLIMLVTQLAVRSIVVRELGLEASGYFQASWVISFTYIGFVLNAMAMDYFPRLTKAIIDHKQAEKLVNEQAEMALLLTGPILIAMITLAPWIIDLLYTQSFSPAAQVLRWQVLGDIFKVASVPIVFIFLAAGHGGVAIVIQLIWSAAYLVPFAMGIGEFGLVMAGVGYGIAYLIYFVAVAIFANRLIGFKLTQRNGYFTITLLVCAGTIMFFTALSTTAGYGVGSLAMLLVSAYSLRRLDQLVGLRGWLRQKFT
jgi:O-antigen/teichoic acid export membrane protein